MKKLRSFFRKEEGSVLVLLALCFTMLLAITALVVDGGRLYHEKSVLQNAMDASALAGAQGLVTSEAEATAGAIDLAEDNSFAIDTSNLTIASNSVKVTRESTVSTVFAKVMGIVSVDVGATATAAIAPLTSGEGISPIAVEKDSIPNNSTLNCATPGEDSGNCGFLQVDDHPNLKQALIDGSEYTTGTETYDTDPGGKMGQVRQGVQALLDKDADRPECQQPETADETCARVITVVVIETFSDLNGSDQVKILGFADYFLWGIADLEEGEDGGDINETVMDPQGDRIIGEFIKRRDVGDGSEENYEDYLITGIKLVN